MSDVAVALRLDARDQLLGVLAAADDDGAAVSRPSGSSAAPGWQGDAQREKRQQAADVAAPSQTREKASPDAREEATPKATRNTSDQAASEPQHC